MTLFHLLICYFTIFHFICSVFDFLNFSEEYWLIWIITRNINYLQDIKSLKTKCYLPINCSRPHCSARLKCRLLQNSLRSQFKYLKFYRLATPLTKNRSRWSIFFLSAFSFARYILPGSTDPFLWGQMETSRAIRLLGLVMDSLHWWNSLLAQSF